MKAVEITMEDGSVWSVDVQTIIDSRDEHREDSKEFFEQYDDEAVDWMQNNMNWDELKAVRVNFPDLPDYSGFCNCEYEIKN
jgi:hypothetical protein